MMTPSRTRTHPTGGFGRHAGSASLPWAMASRMKVSRPRTSRILACLCGAGCLLPIWVSRDRRPSPEKHFDRLPIEHEPIDEDQQELGKVVTDDVYPFRVSFLCIAQVRGFPCPQTQRSWLASRREQVGPIVVNGEDVTR